MFYRQRGFRSVSGRLKQADVSSLSSSNSLYPHGLHSSDTVRVMGIGCKLRKSD